MKKIFMGILMAGIMIVSLTGCTTNKSYTYTVETGDKVKITLNTTDGYDLSSDLPFTISKDGNNLSQGTFIQGSDYEQYVNAAKTQGQIIDKGSNDNIEYVFYSYNNSEYNYVIKIKNSNTALLLGNPNSEEEAKKCFELLSFNLEKQTIQVKS